MIVAVTGPTGELGRAFLRALQRDGAITRVLGMARRPFDTRATSRSSSTARATCWTPRRSTRSPATPTSSSTSRSSSSAAARRPATVNLTGSRNVFRAAREHVGRLVYTSSVAAYGFHSDNPQPLTEDVQPRGSERFYYSAQKAELERVLEEEADGDGAPTSCARASSPGRTRRCCCANSPRSRCCCPIPGTPFQLVHHDDVATALLAATRAKGRPAPTTSPATARSRSSRPRARHRPAGVSGPADPARARRARRQPPLRPNARAVGQRGPHARGHGHGEGAPRAGRGDRANIDTPARRSPQLVQ